MFNFKPIALVGGTVICAVGFLLFIPLITEVIYQTESWQSYAVPILLYLIVGGSLVITNRNVELKISTKEAFIINESFFYYRDYQEKRQGYRFSVVHHYLVTSNKILALSHWLFSKECR